VPSREAEADENERHCDHVTERARGAVVWHRRFANAEKGLIDEYEVYLNPLVWGEGNVHVLGDRGTIRLELADVKRFESGVVLLTYRPAS
jgi:hypothetical protein